MARHIAQVFFEDLYPDLPNRRPEDEGVGVVGGNNLDSECLLPEEYEGESDVALENLLVTSIDEEVEDPTSSSSSLVLGT